MAEPYSEQYHQINTNFGYCIQVQQATELIKKHEENTGTKYALLKADSSFGNSTWNIEDCHIQWEERKRTLGERLTFDGVPFFLLNTRHLGCQFRNENSVKDSNVQNIVAKKESCPGKIILKEVIMFPDYKIASNTYYEKHKWSKVIRDDLCKGEARTERRIYVELPKSEAHTHAIKRKKNNEDHPVPSHCFICNTGLSSAARPTVALFSDEARTSHRQLEIYIVLSAILKQELVTHKMHSTTICSKCFNLLDDVDSLEEQLANKKQRVVDRYVRTMQEVNRNADSLDNAQYSDGNAPIYSDDEALMNYDHKPYGVKRRMWVRKRGKPPGRPRGKGLVIRQGKPRADIKQESFKESNVKLEEDCVETEEMEVPYSLDMTSPSPIKSIREEVTMGDMNSHINHPSRNIKNKVENKGKVAVIEAGDNMVDQAVEELQGNVLEMMDVVLEKRCESERLSCAECDEKFLTKAGIRKHIKEVHSHRNSYDCKECKESFLTRRLFREHKKTHDRRYFCKECDKSFVSRYLLRRHMQSHGSDKNSDKNYVCDICGKALSCQKTLEFHALTHSGERPFQCEICGSTFRQRGNLHFHIKATHHQEKNYHCEICQKSFVRKRLLTYHLNSAHTGERPYKCELCSATFVYPHHYKRHLQKHSGDKQHMCHICSKMFTSRENRNAHLFIHSTNRPYECRICGAGFMRKPLCISHVSGHGQTENPEENIVFNSPSLMVNAAAQGQVSQENMIFLDEGETERAVQAVTMVDGTVNLESPDDTIQIFAVHDDKVVKVMSRPVHIINADDNAC